LYTVWLLLPAVQTTGGALAGCCCVALFGVGVLLDTAYLKRQWLDFLLRVLFAAVLPLILWFYLQRGGGLFWGYYGQQGMFWFPVLFCAYARTRGDKRLWRFVKITVLACVAITTLTTIGWLIQGILRGGRVYAYSRSLGSGEPGRDAYLKELMLRNIGGYDFVYATTLALPITCYAVFASRGWRRALFITLCAAQLVMVVLSQYTYALIFAVSIIMVEWLAAFIRFIARKLQRPLRVGPSLLWALFPLVLAFLLRLPLIAGLASFSESAGFQSIAHSLRLLLGALTGNITVDPSRLDFYRLPLEAWSRSPWIGLVAGGTSMLSQHSDILDLLAGVGLVGSIAVIGMIYGMGRGMLSGMKRHPAVPHFMLQGAILLGCALLGTVTYSRDIALLLCVGLLLGLEDNRALPL